MQIRVLIPLLLAVCLLPGCDKLPGSASRKSDDSGENIDATERAVAGKLRPAKDPIQEEIRQACLETRLAYNNRRFDELEAKAARMRAGKEMFGNGTWKIVEFYNSFDCHSKEPESMWQLHDQIHRAWIAAKPASITARVAYADYLVAYAWHARGTGYANTVTKEGWRLMGERLKAAGDVLEQARNLKDKDPCWWLVGMRVALGQGWNLQNYNALVASAYAFEPKFHYYDTARAYSLLPRWHGKPGDWEVFAAQTALRPNGLGDEAYARILIAQYGYYDNVFQETRASWPKTKQGLDVLLQRYPNSLELLSEAAMLATTAKDREAAKAWYARIGDRYLPSVFGKPDRFAHYRNWAQTGQW